MNLQRGGSFLFLFFFFFLSSSSSSSFTRHYLYLSVRLIRHSGCNQRIAIILVGHSSMADDYQMLEELGSMIYPPPRAGKGKRVGKRRREVD